MLNAQKIRSQMLSGLTDSTLSIRHAWTKREINVPFVFLVSPKKISSLCEAFNESIIKPTSRSTTPETTHPGSERDDEINDYIQINANIDPAYYGSAQWETHKETEFNSFTVRQPQGHRDKNVTNPPLHLNVQIATLPMGTSTFWFLSSQMSQATLMGRNGSYACTFITLFRASTYLRSTNKNILELYVGSPLNSSWITLMLSSIVRGNNAYDRVQHSELGVHSSVLQMRKQT